MKTLITLNIGLNTVNNTRVDVHHALGAIAACGVSITTSAVVNGEWEGKPEPCLLIQGFVTDPLGVAFRAQLYLASRLLSQHVIALYFDGRGELIGENPEGWTFDEELFHFHPEGKRGQSAWPFKTAEEIYLSDCRVSQKEMANQRVDGWLEADFILYLEMLIPDLIESGLETTASDLETAAKFILRK